MNICNWRLYRSCCLLRSNVIARCGRVFSSPSKPKEDKFKIEDKPSCSSKNDWIGPPDPISNIRPVKFGEHPEETDTERSFRQQWVTTIQWNQEFWYKHNTKFFKEKDDFVKNIEQNKGESSISLEDLSKFYKTFLDENRKTHLNYNREWYKRNISLLWPAMKVAFIRGLRRLKTTAPQS
ncbi:APOPT family protein Y39B6A.34, mitochondrial-like [Pomacea canaliculata]|uniref:APOPT family protein Y39B6A.34, mitochondrial-like n=1 Tax=Pomacea canaliculata TaxID=400727 RepID=UPI000D72D955|nr:APOPT family protein Y39B6A.34, mitochondrial-like [Pomacea canaliculata]